MLLLTRSRKYMHPTTSWCEPLERRSLFSTATFNVTTTLDVINPADGLLSLREAVIGANAAKGPVTIKLPAGTYALSITGAAEDAAMTGDLERFSSDSSTITTMLHVVLGVLRPDGQQGAAHGVDETFDRARGVFPQRRLSLGDRHLDGIEVR